VLSTLDELVNAGKVRYVGVSNFSGWHIMKALCVADRYGYPRFAANQAYYSLIGREYEWELMPLSLDQGLGTIVWSPLGWGRLTGNLKRGQAAPLGTRQSEAIGAPPLDDDLLWRVLDALATIATETEKTVPQIALNWLLGRPTVSSVIIGARNEQQLLSNLGAVGWTLSREQIARLDVASDVSKIYPYWHQDQFAERNPSPVTIH
jgi:aryl-alcohol dehydrogenase-like predicted oxidoreductase